MALLRFVAARVLAACLAAGFALCTVVRAQEAESLENDVKAAFLFNFTKFVDWPAAAFHDSAEPLRICVLADAAFTRSLDGIIAGETVRGRPLRRVTPAASDVARCHVLYIARSESRQVQTLLSSVAGAPVLTVGESPQFNAYGGVISFVLVNGRVRFDINPRAAERAGLTVSSRLLRIARKPASGQP